ncbi:peptidoglycan DD-metalloendopeptidase family protein [Longibacter salinarum]|nr:peptidoglycan DD-metalloendopeptidase family protein [Longibacter salinarum]
MARRSPTGRLPAAAALVFLFSLTLLSSGPAWSISSSTMSSTTSNAARSATDNASADAFGIERKKYTVEEHRVRRNQTFADLLLKEGVEYQDIVQLADETRDVFDVRDIRAGRSYRVYRNPWLERARYIVYRPDAVRYVVFDVRYPERSRVGERPVSVAWRTAGGTIKSSLYQTLMESGGRPQLAIRLSEVFAWQIDFFRIQRGDQFRVVYEERTVDGQQIGPGDIVAAYFVHRGRTYYAYRFNDGEGSEYFDEKGNSLRRELLKAPLQFSRISSRFTNRRYHPVLKRYRPHHGTDYAAPTGTPVHSVGDGVVLFAAYKGYNGNYVKVRHNATYTTGYLHLSRIAKGIRPGTRVKQGETIGYVGSTGLSTGPHLDYRFWKNGQAIDPYSIELPPARPVAPQHMTAFTQVVDGLHNFLLNHSPRTTFADARL